MSEENPSSSNWKESIQSNLNQSQVANYQAGIVSTERLKISQLCKMEIQHCFQCNTRRNVQYKIQKGDAFGFICDKDCLNTFKMENADNYDVNWTPNIRLKDENSTAYMRCCCMCQIMISSSSYCLTWQGYDFCNELCLLDYQLQIGSICLQCFREVPLEALGLRCMRFGSDIRQFCSNICLYQHFIRFQMCTFCLQDIMRTPYHIYGKKGKFCSSECELKYDRFDEGPFITNTDTRNRCMVCNQLTLRVIRFESLGVPLSYFCSERCFSVYCKTYNVRAGKCCSCGKFTARQYLKQHTIYENYALYVFCSSFCRKIFIHRHRKLLNCAVCRVQKTNFDMIRKYYKNTSVYVCSLNCLSFCKLGVVSSQCRCYVCHKIQEPKFNFLKTSGTLLFFCSVKCLNRFRVDMKTTRFIVQEYKKVVGFDVSLIPQRIYFPIDDDSSSVASTDSTSNETTRIRNIINESIKQLKVSQKHDSESEDNETCSTLTETTSDNTDDSDNLYHHLFKANLAISKYSTKSEAAFADRIEPEIGLTAWKVWMKNKLIAFGIQAPPFGLLEFLPKDLNICLALFVREIKNLDETQCSPDEIYYCCLGIQKFLTENGRNDDIFYDSQYEDFMCNFNMVITFNICHPLKSKITEDELWDMKQLGDHTPRVLLHTLMFYFVKYLRLKTVQAHMTGLSLKELNIHFVNTNRFPDYIRIKLYPSIENSGKNTVSLLRNFENPRRCPVRLCYLYLTKCPSNVKQCDQLFYLQPENEYEADNTVWFTSRPLPFGDVESNLNRIRLVTEINEMFPFKCLS